MITFERKPSRVLASIPVDDEDVVVFRGDESLSWSIAAVQP
jgi:dihydroorotase